MRAVIQRVKRAEVKVDGGVVGAIGAGLLVYLGVAASDSEKQVEFFARKLKDLRIFKDEQSKMNLSVTDIAGSILLVSNFTLQANCSKGNRPGFDRAARPSAAEVLYENLAKKIRNCGIEVQTGKFGAYMQVESINDGPVNFVLDNE